MEKLTKRGQDIEQARNNVALLGDMVASFAADLFSQQEGEIMRVIIHCIFCFLVYF